MESISISEKFQYFLYELRSNAFYILTALIVGYYVYQSAMEPYLKRRQAEHSYRSATAPGRVSLLNQDLKRVREQQQILANQKAKEAKELKEKKDAEEREKKRVRQPGDMKGGKKLGKSADNSCSNTSSYNPLNPWSGDSARYRPTQRRVNRGS